MRVYSFTIPIHLTIVLFQSSCKKLESELPQHMKIVVELTRGMPNRIRLDNGPEYITPAMSEWAIESGIELKFL